MSNMQQLINEQSVRTVRIEKMLQSLSLNSVVVENSQDDPFISSLPAKTVDEYKEIGRKVNGDVETKLVIYSKCMCIPIPICITDLISSDFVLGITGRKGCQRFLHTSRPCNPQQRHCTSI